MIMKKKKKKKEKKKRKKKTMPINDEMVRKKKREKKEEKRDSRSGVFAGEILGKFGRKFLFCNGGVFTILDRRSRGTVQ